jgi:protein TonB
MDTSSYAGQKITVGGNVQAAKILPGAKATPVYPPLARSARIQGHVVLQAIIGPDGSVLEVKACSGHPMLIPAAIEAVKQWKYQPTMLNDQPVTVVTEIDVNFTLAD